MSGDATRATLSRELSDFLIQLSIAIHRYAMYPDGHPSLGPTVDGLVERLAGLLEERTQLSLGVARNQLVIEGVATDPKNAVLRDLASRLHHHHLGAVTFTRGVHYDELADALQLVAVDADRTGEPLGLSPTPRLASWQHVRLYPLTYDRLQLVGEDPEESEDDESRSARTRAAQLWIGLARAAIASEQADAATGGGSRTDRGDDELPDPTQVARAIEGHKKDAAYDQVIVGYMLQIADELKTGQTPESVALRKRVSRMVSTLDGPTLQRLLEMGGDREQRREFLLSASEGMAVDAVLDLVQAAGQQEQQTISHSLLRMMEKLSQHAERSRGQRRKVAESSMREQMMKLVHNWSLADPNPDGYRQALQGIAASGPLFSVAPDQRYLPEPRRIVEMALEIDAIGEGVIGAVDRLADEGRLPWLLESFSDGRAPALADAVLDRLRTPERLRRVLEHEPLDGNVLDLLLDRLGTDAVGPMLDVLATSDSTKTRRLLMDRLVQMGPRVGALVAERTRDERWYVIRNMLGILAELPELPRDFDALPFMDHPDARVRREALRILLQDDARRERAVCLGLADTDARAVGLAMTAVSGNVPDAALPLLVSRATSGTDPDQRVAAIKALGGARQPGAVAALLQIARPRKALLRTKLPPATPEYLAALAALRSFPDHPGAGEALAAARRSRDARIAEAAGG